MSNHLQLASCAARTTIQRNAEDRRADFTQLFPSFDLGDYVMYVVKVVPTLLNAALILLAKVLIPAVAENATRATTRAYSIRS